MFLFKFINIPVLIISFIIGLFAVYYSMSGDIRNIYIYPTPENVDKVLFKDNANTCFYFDPKIIECPKDENLISSVPIQA